jgi:hypothetical protein
MSTWLLDGRFCLGVLSSRGTVLENLVIPLFADRGDDGMWTQRRVSAAQDDKISEPICCRGWTRWIPWWSRFATTRRGSEEGETKQHERRRRIRPSCKMHVKIGVTAEPRYPSSRPSPTLILRRPTNKTAWRAALLEGVWELQNCKHPPKIGRSNPWDANARCGIKRLSPAEHGIFLPDRCYSLGSRNHSSLDGEQM